MGENIRIWLILIILASPLYLSGCDKKTVPEEDTGTESEVETAIHSVLQGDAEMVIIDGCEYIVYKETNGNNQGFGFMTHKGNCKNPIHHYHTSEQTDITP